MEIRVYEYTTEGITPKAITETFESLNFREDAFRYGSFRLTIPTDYPEINEFQKNRLVLFDKYYCGIITGINHDVAESGEITEISGIEAKGLLSYRITIPPSFTTIQGLAGYDAVTGDYHNKGLDWIARDELKHANYWISKVSNGKREYQSRYDKLEKIIDRADPNAGVLDDFSITLL